MTAEYYRIVLNSVAVTLPPTNSPEAASKAGQIEGAHRLGHPDGAGVGTTHAAEATLGSRGDGSG